MRKILLTLLFVAVAWSASAQRFRTRVEWGVVGGINLPNYETSIDGIDVSNKLGWQAGIITSIQWNRLFAIEPQILYVRQGLRVKPDGGKEINLKSHSIDVPVLVSLRMLDPVRIFVGPVFTVMNDCKQKTGGDLLDFSSVRPTFSYTAGVGIALASHMYIDVRYNGQFRSKRDVVLPNDMRLDKLRNWNIAFSFGYLF